MNVLLIGFRGTGKTTTARLLAEQLQWPWYDADAMVQESAGQSIARIFATEGEEGFRRREAVVVAELTRLDRAVLALGGGAILWPENRRRIKAAGVVIWLTAEPRTIHQRLQQDEATAGQRPQLTASGGCDEIVQLLAQRAPLYQETSHWSVTTDDKSPQHVAAEILTRLRPLPGNRP